MKKLIIRLSFLFTPIAIMAQEPTSQIQVISQYSSEIPDVEDLMSMSKIRYEKIRFSSEDLIGKDYAIRALEIWDGEVRDSAVLIDSRKTKKPITDSIFELRVANKLDDDKNILIRFATPTSSTNRLFKTAAGEGGMYSLRNLTKETKKDIEMGKTFYLMAFVKPIAVPGQPGRWSYCNVESSGENVREWGKKLKLDHYIVYEMAFF